MATDPLNSSTDQNLQVILASVSPILTQLPKWIELGAYLEFGDDEVRLCELCHDVCEWVYFKVLKFNSDGLELCGSCLEKCKKKSPWKLYVREGLIFFLGSLNAFVRPSASENPPAGSAIKAHDALQLPASVLLESGSPTCSLVPSSRSGQLLELHNSKPVTAVPLHLAASLEPLHVAPMCELAYLISNSKPVPASCSDQVFLTTNTDPVRCASNAEPLFTPNVSRVSFMSNSEPLLLSPSREPLHCSSNPEPVLCTKLVQFTPHSDPVLLSSNSEPVLFTSNAEPVQFLSLSKPVLVTSNPEPVISTSYVEPGDCPGSLSLISKSEPLRFTSTSEPMLLTSNFESLPKTLKTQNHEAVLITANSGTLPLKSNSETSKPNDKVILPHSEKILRTQSKSGKKVSDDTLVDRMRTIVQQECRLGKDLCTTGIELTERYNSHYKHETIHVRRVFEAMKTLGYVASKDTMQVQVQKVRRKVKLIYGLAMM